MDKKKILLTILIVATVGFICCVGIVVYYYGSLNKQQNEYEKLAEQAKQTAEVSTEKADEDVAKEYVSPIDFDMLCNEKNDDIYAWIKVEGTNINYPFVQANDNQYYLGLLEERIGKAHFGSIYNTAIRHKNTGKQYGTTL